MVNIAPKNPKTYIHTSNCITNYPDGLINLILDAKGPAYVCDEIKREQDPTYIQHHLELTITAHISPAQLAGKRLLDFGCGAGASTVILAKMLPQTQIIGIELEPKNLAIAKARAKFYNLKNVSFQLSPSGLELPANCRKFDAIVLSAVFEHLLPDERKILLPKLWHILNHEGFMFFDETPNRWFPIETHTTHLPLINYLPDNLALLYARHCSKRIDKKASWQSLLRSGIRGGTVKQIKKLLDDPCYKTILMTPSRKNIYDHVSLWQAGYLYPQKNLKGRLKRIAVPFLKIASDICGTPITPYLSLAFTKQ